MEDVAGMCIVTKKISTRKVSMKMFLRLYTGTMFFHFCIDYTNGREKD